jgi:hypothetical protein
LRVRSLLLVLPVAAILVLFGAGCGGIDKGKLESAIKSQTNTQLENAGRPERVSTVSCVKTSDSYHYTCDLKNDAGKTVLTVKAICTKDGTCRWGKQR